ncbi:MAG: hypothetical protein SGPRY_005263 [Prymnesium sp.]
MQACPRSCNSTQGGCKPKAVCSGWGHASPSRSDRSSDPAIAPVGPVPQVLGLSSVNATTGRGSKLLRLELDLWSPMFPEYRVVRTACPGAPSLACCLEAGLWSLGAKNAKIKRALWHPCSFHEAAMFPFQQWKVECSPNEGGVGGGGEGEGEGGEATQGGRGADERHAAWLRQVAEREGSGALSELLPFQLLGVNEFAPQPEVKAVFRRLSRIFHPDKAGKESPYSPPIFEALQAAVEKMGAGGWREEALGSESLRFFTDPSIVELNRTEHESAVASEGPMWLIIYFAPWCHQCITNR